MLLRQLENTKQLFANAKNLCLDFSKFLMHPDFTPSLAEYQHSDKGMWSTDFSPISSLIERN
jgi:hypothetical protein